ncbi:DUF6455 family protein [Pannonibacter tanglangensis]|uniref:DUF6455 domain-containing protein n=1 Tax=Pannonibacter tanglangensis TaxID=2750084 RepID=A0ABW9ZG03_9HYPH|nr:DUF6455 family protein [Pannonibacter sp. XCT-34]NBN63788.1 hypothetical protein [Pannonibacter sp. XCT-34]
MSWMDRLNERAELMGRMMRTVGAMQAGHAATGTSEIRLAASRCMGCDQAEACRHWLDAHPEGADKAPDLCPNQDLFSTWQSRG